MQSVTYHSEAWTGRPADAPVPSLAVVAKQFQQTATFINGRALARLAAIPPLKQAAGCWLFADAGMSYFGATPQAGTPNEFLIICGVGGIAATTCMLAFGDGRAADKIKIKNRFLKQLNAFGEQSAGYIQFAASTAMTVGGLLPGGFHQVNELYQNFLLSPNIASTVQAVTASCDPGLLLTGSLAAAGAAFQAFGKPTNNRTIKELCGAVKGACWQEAKTIVKNLSPYDAASKIYIVTNAFLAGTGIHYLISGTQGLVNGLMVAVALPLLYTLGSYKLGQSQKAEFKLKPTPLKI